MSTTKSQRWLLAVLIVLGVGTVVWGALGNKGESHDSYEAANARIERTMPEDSGTEVVPQHWDVSDDLTIVFETHEASSRLGRRLVIRIEEAMRWTLPYPPDNTSEEAVAVWRREHLHPTLSQVVEVVASLIAERNEAVATLRTPRSRGGLAVPPHVVASVLVVLGQAGVTDITMDGRPN